MMGSIYEIAKVVLVWLGRDNGDARKAFDLTRDLSELATMNRRNGRVPPPGEVYFNSQGGDF